MLQNFGPKFKYDEVGIENFQPTNMRIGAGFDFIFDLTNTLAITTELTKLLVPSPPIYGNEYNYTDTNNNGTYEEDVDELGNIVNRDIIIKGTDPNIGFLSGVFKSFSDAPGGGKEELQEVTWALGAEYRYSDVFAIRAGYFNESVTKGARKFFSLGTGVKFNKVNVDLSYLFSTSNVQSPLEGTVRFGITFNIQPNTYREF